MRRPSRGFAALLLAASVVLAACGGGDAASPASSGAAATSPSGSVSPSPVASTSGSGTSGSGIVIPSPSSTYKASPACVSFGSLAAQGSKESPGEKLSGITGRTMRVAHQPCLDRFVFEFAGTGPVPGWSVAYGQPLGEATGEPITPPLRGNSPMTVHFGAWADGAVLDGPPFVGPTTIYPTTTRAIREARVADQFEGVSVVGLGLERKRAFRAYWLTSPMRLVVDVYTG